MTDKTTLLGRRELCAAGLGAAAFGVAAAGAHAAENAEDTEPKLKSRFLFEMEAELEPQQDIGDRQIYIVKSGIIRGPRINGIVLPGGGDWATRRPDGSTMLDVRATMKMMTATFLTMLSYVVIGLAVLVIVRLPEALWVAPLVFTGLFLSGWATIRVLERQAVLRRGFAVLATLVNLKREVVRLRDERERLRARLLEIVDRFIDPDLERVVSPDEQGGDTDTHNNG